MEALYSNLAFSLDTILEKIKSVPPYNFEYQQHLKLLKELYPSLEEVPDETIPVSEILTYFQENKPELFIKFKKNNEIIEERELLDEVAAISNIIPDVTPEIQETHKLSKNTTFGFFFDKKKDTSNIETILDGVWKKLKGNNLIEKRNKFSVFKKIFSHGKITEKTVWLGDVNQLYFFIHELMKFEAYNNERNSKKWQITVQCFCLPNQVEIRVEQLHRTKKPNQDKQNQILEALLPFKKFR